MLVSGITKPAFIEDQAHCSVSSLIQSFIQSPAKVYLLLRNYFVTKWKNESVRWRVRRRRRERRKVDSHRDGWLVRCSRWSKKMSIIEEVEVKSALWARKFFCQHWLIPIYT